MRRSLDGWLNANRPPLVHHWVMTHADPAAAADPDADPTGLPVAADVHAAVRQAASGTAS